MSAFKLKSQLPLDTQKEIDRVQAKASGLRNAEEAAFLVSIDNDYFYNEVVLRNAANEIMIAQGRTVPDGYSGFAVGAYFTKINAATGENSLYQNVGTTSVSAFTGVGGRIAPITISSAQILDLHDTPVTLVAAPGAGKLNIVDEVMLKMTFLTAAYTGANALEIRYTDGSGAKVTADFPASTAFLNVASGSAYGVNKAVVTTLVPVANAPIVAVVPVADPGAGAGSITGFVRYHVVTL